MTLTNHTQRIEELAHQVLNYADQRSYEEAHEALDEIEKEVRELRRHIDHLQFVTHFSLKAYFGK